MPFCVSSVRSFALALTIALPSCVLRGPLLVLRDDAAIDDSSERDAAPATDVNEEHSDSALDAVDAMEAGNACGPAVVDPSTARAVSSGQSHSCAVRAGAMYCWGANNEGALGTGDAVDRNAPTRVTGAHRWIAVAAAGSSTCAIDDARAVWCWGDNGSGQLATGDNLAHTEPVQVRGLCDVRVISGTFDHYCAIDGSGRLWCWGHNEEGQLGQSDSYPGRNALAPVPVLEAERFRAVAAGQGHTCAIANSATLYCWGRNTDGQLGLGAAAPIQVRAPQPVGALSGWTSLSVGQDQACALRAGGELHCWGAGDAVPMGLAREPVRVGAEADFNSVSVSTFAACATRGAARALYCWGRNDEGQLGLGTTTSASAPTLVSTARPTRELALGRFHACLLDDALATECTGENNRGQLGVGDNVRRAVFTPTR